MALEGDVKIPGGGKVPKKAAAAGVVIVGTLIGVYYYRKRSSSATATGAAAASSTDQYPPDGTTGNPSDPYSTDPATGQTYGDEAAGSGGALGAFGSGAASGLYYDPATGAYDLTSPYGTQGTSPYQTQGGPPFSSNSAWSDWVVQELQAQDPSINVGNLVNAIGAYLEGQPVSAAQKTLIFDALAIGGDPPVAGPAGYPPKVRTSGNGGGTTETVPDVKGKDADTALEALKDAHLTGKLSEDRKAGKTYLVIAQSPAAGKRVAENSTVRLTIQIKPSTGHPESKVVVPVTYGKRADAAISEMRARGLKAVTNPQRKPGFSYWSYGSQPEGNTKVDKGTTVTITVAEGKPGTNIPGKGK